MTLSLSRYETNKITSNNNEDCFVNHNEDEKENISDINIFNADDKSIDIFLDFIKHGNENKALLSYEQLINGIKTQYKKSLKDLGIDFDISEALLEKEALKQIQERLRETTGVTLSEFITTYSDNTEESHKQEELFA